jgi:hypothetical protein
LKKQREAWVYFSFSHSKVKFKNFTPIAYNVWRLCEGLMALHFRPKPLPLLGFVIGSKFIPQPAFCKTACYV